MTINKWLTTMALSTLCVVSVARTASAIPLEWTLKNVSTFGSTVTGSFVYDAATNVYSDINITTANGSVLPNQTWTNYVNSSLHPSNAASFQLIDVDTDAADKTGANSFAIVFLNNLTDAGGTILMGYVLAGTCDVPGCWRINSYPNGGDGQDFGATGSFEASAVAPTPLPAALPLFATGLGALGFIAHRRKRKQAA